MRCFIFEYGGEDAESRGGAGGEITVAVAMRFFQNMRKGSR
jgi:hypothetical protein